MSYDYYDFCNDVYDRKYNVNETIEEFRNDNEEVYLLAKNIRKISENFVNKYDGWYGKNLCGLCAVSSGWLFNELRKHGYKDCGLIVNSSHCFLVYKNKYIIDVTATQFDFFNDVVIVDQEKLSKPPYFWRKEAYFDNIDDLYVYQKRLGWDESQTVGKNY